MIRLIDDMLIYFVRDNKGIVFFRKIGYDFQFIIGEYLAAGIGRIAEDQSFWFLFKSILKLNSGG